MKLEWTEPALLDLECIRDHIKRDSEFYANRFVERIIEAVEGLEQFPEMGRWVPEAEAENIANISLRHVNCFFGLNLSLKGLMFQSPISRVSLLHAEIATGHGETRQCPCGSEHKFDTRANKGKI